MELIIPKGRDAINSVRTRMAPDERLPPAEPRPLYPRASAPEGVRYGGSEGVRYGGSVCEL